VKVFRIERQKYLSTTLQGIGASMTDGFRWNSQHTRIVYTSESRSLAMLEIAVHLNIHENLPNDRYLLEIDIPDNIQILEVMLEDLPENWDAKPPTLETQTIGDDFVYGNDAAVLKVPSAIIPEEFNYLINPNHKDAKRIKVFNERKLEFDERLGREL
jgi:RES domain-containing protein